ncbi:MAG: alpha-glucan family phosphorylase [bacterium]
MPPIKPYKYNVVPFLPKNLEPLRDIAYNLLWTWNHKAVDLFLRLDRELWKKVTHNPVMMLGMVSQERLDFLSGDDSFLAHQQRVQDIYHGYEREDREKKTWFKKKYQEHDDFLVAYFSAEYGLSECLPIYSGGLGILAGDHLKSSSDLGLPMVGVGLLYQQGYFHQYLNRDGWQQESYPHNDFYTMPLKMLRRKDGQPLMFELDFPDGSFLLRIWEVRVGRIRLYLLDTNIKENSTRHQAITSQLYGGDNEMRVRQEIVLGVGGVRALKLLGIKPTVYHMNEGHSAFLGLERIREAIKNKKLSFEEAREVTAAGNVFTTHTPVPAGIDVFPREKIKEYFAHFIRDFGISEDKFLALGEEYQNGMFSMAVLALRLARNTNGVSRLHGEVSRKMWCHHWPDVPLDEVPISHVTNGVHLNSWVSKEMFVLLRRYLGPGWIFKPAEKEIWKRIEHIPAEELWMTRGRLRERLVVFSRRKLSRNLIKQGASPRSVAQAEEVLNPDTLTIGFGRRFATYKRATLIFYDVERLINILNNKDRPVQLIFAGKAHPRDNAGKDLIKHIIHVIHQYDLRHRIVFLEDYDIDVSRNLIQGVDVWLNTPRRFQEASGTSGMKATVNGGINFSIIDGWWDEAYSNDVGWAIGHGEKYDDFNYQDQVESNAIYDMLEQVIVPKFYERGRNGIPRRWVDLMKTSMINLCPVFNTDRMIQNYVQQSYVPAHERQRELSRNGFEVGKQISGWKKMIRTEWDKVRVAGVEADISKDLKVGRCFSVSCRVFLGNLSPGDVRVELYYGVLDHNRRISGGKPVQMTEFEEQGKGYYNFSGCLPCERSGRHGFYVRVIPYRPELSGLFEMNMITWGENES